MKTSNLLYTLLIGALLTLTSCLDEGEETFALQKGDFTELIQGAWEVEECRLYDPETELFISELANEASIDNIYILGNTQTSKIILPNGETASLSWSADEDDQILTLNSESFYIESLGRELMVLTTYGVINNDRYLVKYYLERDDDDLNTIGNNNEDDFTYVVSSDRSGRFTRFGYTIQIPVGAVPLGDSNSTGTIAFSGSRIGLTDLPGSAPSGVQFLDGTGVMFNPSNFTFASPIIIDVPLNNENPGSLNLYHWNALNRNWDLVPFSSFTPATGRASVIQLGYFVLGRTQGSRAIGGIRIPKEQIMNDYIYYLSIVPTNGNTNQTQVTFASNTTDLLMAPIPTGSYKVQMSRQKRSGFTTAATSIEHTEPITLNVSNRILYTPEGEISGWTILNINNMPWYTGRPNIWGTETVTYGTGTFQATLNWVNYNNSTVDYDLHLTTPNNTEIYYAHKSGDGFRLDRDMTSEVGQCTENIFSINEQLPRGTYTVSVNHFSGTTGRTYNCRIILNGRVVKDYTGITNSGTQKIYTFTLQ